MGILFKLIARLFQISIFCNQSRSDFIQTFFSSAGQGAGCRLHRADHNGSRASFGAMNVVWKIAMWPPLLSHIFVHDIKWVVKQISSRRIPELFSMVSIYSVWPPNSLFTGLDISSYCLSTCLDIKIFDGMNKNISGWGRVVVPWQPPPGRLRGWADDLAGADDWRGRVQVRDHFLGHHQELPSRSTCQTQHFRYLGSHLAQPLQRIINGKKGVLNWNLTLYSPTLLDECQTESAKVLTLPWKQLGKTVQTIVPKPVPEFQVDSPSLCLKEYPDSSKSSVKRRKTLNSNKGFRVALESTWWAVRKSYANCTKTFTNCIHHRNGKLCLQRALPCK